MSRNSSLGLAAVCVAIRLHQCRRSVKLVFTSNFHDRKIARPLLRMAHGRRRFGPARPRRRAVLLWLFGFFPAPQPGPGTEPRRDFFSFFFGPRAGSL